MTTATNTASVVTDDHILASRTTVEITPVQPSDVVYFNEPINFGVSKYKTEGDTTPLFVAMVNGVEYYSIKSVTDLNSKVANGHNDTPLTAKPIKVKDHYIANAQKWEPVKNEEPEKPESVLTDDQQARLDELRDMIAKSVMAGKEGVIKARAAVFEIGTELNEARAILDASSTTGKPVSFKTWGPWLATNMPMALKGKNAPSEHMLCAAMPEYIQEACPSTKVSAKSISMWYSQAQKALGARIARKVLSVDDELFDAVAEAKDPTLAKDQITECAQEIADTFTSLVGADVPMDGVNIDEVELQKQEDETAIAAIAKQWVEGEDEKARVRISGAIGKEVLAFVSAKTPEQEDADAAEKDAEAYGNKESKVMRGFVNFPFDEAVQHLIKIAVARDDFEAVLLNAAEGAQAYVDGIAQAAEKAAEEADQKAADS